jgi:hypothetical protein
MTPPDRIHPDDVEAIARRVVELLTMMRAADSPSVHQSPPDHSNGRAPDLDQRVLAFVAAHGPVSKNGVRRGVKGRGVLIDQALRGLARDGRVQEVDGFWEACPAAPEGRDVPGEGHESAASVEPPRTDSSRALPDEPPPGPLVPLVAEPTAPAPAPSAYDPFGEFA